MSDLKRLESRAFSAGLVSAAKAKLPGDVAKLIALGLALLVLVLTCLPWQQTAPGKGKVLAFAPLSRPQVVEAPVEGRVVRWWVQEGSLVKKGDPLLQISDLDPALMTRMQAELVALEARAQDLEARARAQDARALALTGGRGAALASARGRQRSAAARLVQARTAMAAARPAAEVARLNLARQKALAEQSLASTRAVELAYAEEAKASNDLARAEAAVASAQADLSSAEADVARAGLDGQAVVEDAKAGASSARADGASVRAEIARMRVRLSRQGAQVLKANMAGMVTRVQGGREGEMVRPGDVLLSLVPSVEERAIEIFVNGLDAPLIQVGQVARVQLEGWPAVALPGWPVAMVGSFGARVAVVEPALDAEGLLRILAVPDGVDPWPPPGMLRQGLRAKAWVMLGVVPLGYEFWRLANGFPPQKPSLEESPKVLAPLQRLGK